MYIFAKKNAYLRRCSIQVKAGQNDAVDIAHVHIQQKQTSSNAIMMMFHLHDACGLEFHRLMFDFQIFKLRCLRNVRTQSLETT